MHARLARADDLPKLKETYGRIIERMDEDGMNIWDEFYPCGVFGEDIENSRLYVTTDDGGNIAAAFALCGESGGEDGVKWEDANSKAMYIYRLGVSVDFSRRGLGSAALDEAALLAGEKGAEYLRLLVVDINLPAINLYLKNGFRQAGGIHDEKIAEDFVLREYGFEKELF